MKSRIVVALFAILAVMVIPVYPHFVSPNEFSRWVLAAALVEHHTTEVSQVAGILGARFEDLATVDGRVYSNKAPGAALVGTIGYLIARPIAGPPSADSMRPVLTAMRLVAATLPLILLALLMIRLADRFGRRERASFAVATLLFGTPLLAYGLLLFAHALVAAALFAAWAFLFVEERPLMAGALLGLAVLSEYPAALPALILLVIAATERRWKRVLAAIAGALPFAVLLALYQYLSFGSIFRLSYTYEKLPEYRQVSHSGFYGIHWPSLITIAKFFFHPAVGLFVLSPVLILALVAMPQVRRELSVRAFLALVLAPLSTVLLYAGYPNWLGGWSVGPRYILSVVPFLVFSLLFRKGDWLEPLLLGFSVVAVGLVTLVFPFVPPDFTLPWGSLSLSLLGRGLVAPNLVHVLWPPAAVAAPFAVAGIALIAATGRRGWLAGIGGAVAVMLALIAARELTMRQRIERAYIEDVFFERRGALERAVPAGTPPTAPIFRRRDGEMKLPPSSWRF